MLKNSLFILLFLTASLGNAQDMFQEYLYSADVVMKNRDKISLSDAQAEKIKKIHSTNAADFSTLKWDLDAATEKLKKLLAESKPDAVAVSKQMDVVLDIENRLKKKQLSTLVAIKNELTENQQASLNGSKNWMLYASPAKIPSTFQNTSPQIRVGTGPTPGSSIQGQVKGVTVTPDASDSWVINSDPKSKIYLQMDPKSKGDNPIFYLKTNNGLEEFFDFDKIKPDDIQSIEVLKGESATIRFGEKAKNGAIIITLKK
ncbi:Spy/CpxP family protein refolding chaperone [Cognataquiflexum aquatile]|uniref:Spy/CpxP family protein refolding chaperone n=1 Tax=Cognataquiflexum aquatile TaxID=2249427 RepID=UPI000DE8D90D|nr:TonB-dependent receptor plug domain-containing protein [Cognataquiflexum aquatile]